PASARPRLRRCCSARRSRSIAPRSSTVASRSAAGSATAIACSPPSSRSIASAGWSRPTAAATTSCAIACIADRASTCSRCAPRIAEAAAQLSEAERARDSFQAAFRRAVLRAAELRAAEKLAEAIAELERIARLAPPDSDEHARLQEVIAESRLEVGEHQGALTAAQRALRKLPNSPLALRVQRDALVELGEVANAIPVAHELAVVDNTPQR